MTMQFGQSANCHGHECVPPPGGSTATETGLLTVVLQLYMLLPASILPQGNNCPDKTSSKQPTGTTNSILQVFFMAADAE